MFWSPARDGLAGVVVHADDGGEGDEQRDRVAVAETIDEIVIVLLDFARFGEGVDEIQHCDPVAVADSSRLINTQFYISTCYTLEDKLITRQSPMILNSD